MIPLTILYDEYIDRPKLTEQKNPVEYIVPPSPLKWGSEQQEPDKRRQNRLSHKVATQAEVSKAMERIERSRFNLKTGKKILRLNLMKKTLTYNDQIDFHLHISFSNVRLCRNSMGHNIYAGQTHGQS